MAVDHYVPRLPTNLLATKAVSPSAADAANVCGNGTAFARYAEALHPLFVRLIRMPPVTITTLPRDAPKECVYLFSEQERHLYVGRTRHLRQRMRQHSMPSSRHNQAVFAFRLARETTGRLTAAYTGDGTRALLASGDLAFAAAFTDAKARIRSMRVRYVEETDSLRQALLEIYASIVLATPYNDFNTLIEMRRRRTTWALRFRGAKR